MRDVSIDVSRLDGEDIYPRLYSIEDRGSFFKVVVLVEADVDVRSSCSCQPGIASARHEQVSSGRNKRSAGTNPRYDRRDDFNFLPSQLCASILITTQQCSSADEKMAWLWITGDRVAALQTMHSVRWVSTNTTRLNKQCPG